MNSKNVVIKINSIKRRHFKPGKEDFMAHGYSSEFSGSINSEKNY